MPRLNSSHDLAALREALTAARAPNRVCVTLCSGTGCLAYKSHDVFAAFQQEVAARGLDHDVELRRTGCYGFCERGPVMVVLPRGICYLGATAADVSEIVEETLVKGKVVERLTYEDPDTHERIAAFDEIPFYKYQMRLLLKANAQVDPTRIDDYIAIGGYAALAKALTGMTPEQVLDEVTRADLRGRGGGGFATGRKWATTRDAPGEPKYVVVNADEGDPGAYMDRSLLEGNPHSVLEGLILGAYAIGAREGYVYVRQEYPLAVENVGRAIEAASDYGLLGENILGSGFDFTVHVRRGAGAFVSGESSALMASIEGRVGEPHPKYIHTSVQGLWGKPTCLNNVETWANVPHIVRRGADWYAGIGTQRSKGTKIFSLVGKVNNTGLVEVPMGLSLRRIVYDIGGGVPGGKKLKAVQTGGPSGGVIPEELLDLPVDFDKLSEAGSMMGSGGLIVMDEDTCMVDTARYYVDFLAHESCGKCVPCREGLRQMLKILDRITGGEGREGDVELLEELSEFMRVASLCALGKTAPNPVLSTIRHFRDEYDAHIRERRCPAGVCKELIAYTIDPDVCIGCGTCAKNCPADAIAPTADEKGSPYAIDQGRCVKCGNCLTVCPPKVRAVAKRPVIDVLENA